MNEDLKVLLIGPGKMGIEYSKVLEAQKISYDVIGRGSESADRFCKLTGKEVKRISISDYFKNIDRKPTHVIIATGVLQLATCAVEVLNHNVKNLLIEKPAGISYQEISEIALLAERKRSNVYVGYNRRFYASTEHARKVIETDGGVSSFHFEFTEWPDKFVSMYRGQDDILKKWFLANSTHVADLAFFLGGKPERMNAYVSGKVDWHPQGSIFSGAGISDKRALFTYQANWEAPGRWNVEILTKCHRLYFKPMEKLQIQKINSMQIDTIDIEDLLDTMYKPGLYSEVYAFVHDVYDDRKKTIAEQLYDMKLYDIIETGGMI